MKNRYDPKVVDAARRLIQVSATVWQIRPESAHAIARRAPHGYVSRRLVQRLQKSGSVVACPTTQMG
jgi:hypothetical protein